MTDLKWQTNSTTSFALILVIIAINIIVLGKLIILHPAILVTIAGLYFAELIINSLNENSYKV